MTPDDNEIFPTTSQAGEAGDGDTIVLEFASFREFIDQYSAKISDEGLFIASDQPREVGESVSFEVRLSDDFRLIQGQGDVVWRVPAGTPEHEAGMGIRFDQIDEPSRRLITRLVNNHRGEGGAVFDLETHVETSLESGRGPAASGELFVTDPTQGAPAPSSELADELFGESPFQVPAGPETIALPRDLVPPAETAGLDDLIEPEQPSEPLHPLGPLAPLEPTLPLVQPPVEVTPDPEPQVAEVPVAPSAGFVEEAVPEIDEDFVSGAGVEPAVLPEIAPPEPKQPPESSSVSIADMTLGPGPGASPVENPVESLVESAHEEAASEVTVPLPGDDREIPVAAPEAILEALTELREKEPFVPELGLEQTTTESSEGPAPPEISGETSQITHEVDGGPMPDVEMPEPEEMGDDYTTSYAASADTPSAGPGKWLWIGLCVVAIALGGLAAVRYQDRLRELMPWIPGGDRSTELAADRPSLEELRARLLGEKEAAKAAEVAEAATDAVGGTADAADAESAVAEGTAAGGSPANRAAKPEAEASPVTATEPAVDSQPAPEVVEVASPSGPGASTAGSPITDGSQSAGRLESIQWTQQSGSTIVKIATAGPLSRESFDHVRVSQGAPREVIKVFGVSEPFPSRVYEVGGDHVIRLRTGSHPGGEVHIVADLADGSVRMTGIDVVGKTLRVTFSR